MEVFDNNLRKKVTNVTRHTRNVGKIDTNIEHHAL